ncbi:hypothetical protein BS330_11695 [Amycolatopsis keratiniphila subsp. nogabecina]|nr:hypothetical protein BS330_11695 [Amycolatopsis keratiniphila subsp. nogabecina]
MRLSVVKERSTRQKALVASLLKSENRFRSAQALYAQLRTRGVTIGLSTVYRNLQSMVETGKACRPRGQLGVDHADPDVVGEAGHRSLW